MIFPNRLTFGLVILLFITGSCNNETLHEWFYSKLPANITQKGKENMRLLEGSSLNLYKNRIFKSDSLLNLVDSLELTDEVLGFYYLNKGLLNHKRGRIKESIGYIEKATEIFEKNNFGRGKADADLAIGIVFEDKNLPTEAAKSYFDALGYYDNHQQSEKYFYVLMGLARTAPDKDIFFNKAREYLNKNPDEYNSFYLIKTQAYIERDIQKKHMLYRKALESCSINSDPREFVNIYSSLALDCRMLGNIDSANLYLQRADQLVETGKIPQTRLLHYRLIKAYIYFYSGKVDIAMAVLDSAIKYSGEQPAMLKEAIFRKAEINASQKNYKSAISDLLVYLQNIKEDFRSKQTNQLALLSIRYQVRQKQMDLLKERNRWLLAMIFLLIVFITLFIILVYKKNKSNREKQAMKDLVSITISDRDKWQRSFELISDEFKNQIQKNHSLGKRDLDDNDIFKWEDFRVRFVSRNPLFIEKLTKNYPRLTSTNIRYCMCISCDMSNNTIAGLLAVSKDAVKKARGKLKREFNLESVNLLSNYLNSFKEE